jgi:tRNA-binding protein
MSYSLFYNYKGVGDVLMIGLKPGFKTTHFETKGDVTAIFQNEDLIGFNLFNIKEIVKISVSGLITQPPLTLIQIINDTIKNAGFNFNLPPFNSGYVVGGIQTIIPHPESDHLRLCRVDIGQKIISVVTNSKSVKEGQKVVVALAPMVLFNGTELLGGKILNVSSEGMFCSSVTLGLDDNDDTGIMELNNDEKIGRDYFKGE